MTNLFLYAGPRQNYFVKGHLVAHADKFYFAEQFTTYFYANAVPMWDSVNNGNWKIMEEAVRGLTVTKGDLGIWVGGFGVLQLNGRDIYLALNKAKQPALPVPKVIFKMVYSLRHNQMMVFLAANNPYVVDGDLAEYVVCRPYTKCQEMENRFNNKENGFLYCCLYQDFMASPTVQALVGLQLQLPPETSPFYPQPVGALF